MLLRLQPHLCLSLLPRQLGRMAPGSSVVSFFPSVIKTASLGSGRAQVVVGLRLRCPRQHLGSMFGLGRSGVRGGGDDFAVSTLLSRTLKSFLSGLSGFHS